MVCITFTDWFRGRTSVVCMTFTDWFRGRTSVWFVLLLLTSVWFGLEEGRTSVWFVLLLLIGLEKKDFYFCVVCITFTDWFRGRTSVWFVLLLLIGLEEGLLCGLYDFY